MAEREIIRGASSSDFVAVMNLNNDTYDGLDYLPSLFQSYIDNPNILCWVAEVGELVVGFITMHYLEEDKTIVSIAKRVHREHQGKGIAGRLVKEAIREAKETWPCAMLHTWSSLYVPAYDKMMADPNWKARLIQKWDIFVLCMPYKEARAAVSIHREKSKLDHRVASTDVRNLMAILDRTPLEELFPHSSIIHGNEWLPKTVTRPNLVSVLESSKVFYSLDESHSKCVVLSTCSILKVGSTSRSIFAIYSGVKDYDLCGAHLERHLMEAVGEAEGSDTVAFCYSCPVETEYQAAASVLKPVLGKDVKMGWAGLAANAITLEEEI